MAQVVERQILELRLHDGPAKADFQCVLCDLDHATVLAAIKAEQNLLYAGEEGDGARVPILRAAISVLALRAAHVNGPRLEVDVGPLQRADLSLTHSCEQRELRRR